MPRSTRLLLLGVPLAMLLGGCQPNSCIQYFAQVDTKCPGSGVNGDAGAGQTSSYNFTDCQIALCDRSDPGIIDCGDPSTFIPLGIDGGFLACVSDAGAPIEYDGSVPPDAGGSTSDGGPHG